MEFSKVFDRAKEVKALYSELEIKQCGRPWTVAEVAQGFCGDVGLLMKWIMAQSGLRGDISDVDEKVEHELCDCLWSVFTLASRLNIDLEKSFMVNMDILEKRINKESNQFYEK